MTFYTALILLGNGLLASNARTTPSEASNADLLNQKASCICYDAAKNISIIARRYRSAFGSFRRSPISATHCLLSAALVLIQVASNSLEAKSRRATVANIDMCLQCLDELSVSWSPAGRIHRNLTLLQAQKLSDPRSTKYGADITDTQTNTIATTPTLETNYQTTVEALNFTYLNDYDLMNPAILHDAPSFLESCTDGGNTIGGFDPTAYPAGTGVQDPFFWGNFTMDFTNSEV